MENERRFEIQNKIVTVEQIMEVSDYLQKTLKYYLDLINQDLAKNNNAYFDDATYKYYTSYKPHIEYTIDYLDGREVKTEDEFVFKDCLKEPQYLKSISEMIYISYKNNEFGDVTEHSMSLYVSFNDSFITFSTSNQNMNEEEYNLNSYVRSIIEKGGDRLSKIVKNRFWVKNTIGLAAGSILTLIIFIIILLTRDSNNSFDFLFNNPILITLLGWLSAFAFGSTLVSSIVNNLYKKIENGELNYAEYGGKYTENFENSYSKSNEVLIGKFYNNLEKRKTIEKYYNLSKKVVLIRLAISLVILVVLSLI